MPANKSESDCVEISLPDFSGIGTLYTITGESIASYNDVDHPDDVKITEKQIDVGAPVVLPPHSVSVLVFER